MGAYTKGGLFGGGGVAWKLFLVVGHIPVEIFLLMNHFFDSAHASNRVFFMGQANFR